MQMGSSHGVLHRMSIIKEVKGMDDFEYELLNMSQEEMERIANGEDTNL